jgi:hypothetical protein
MLLTCVVHSTDLVTAVLNLGARHQVPDSIMYRNKATQHVTGMRQ